METSKLQQNPTKCPHCGKDYFHVSPVRCACGYYFDKKRYEEKGETEQTFNPRYYGVKGWLLLFCLSLTIFSPLYTAYTLFVSYEEVSLLFKTYPVLEDLVTVDIYLSIGLMIFSIYAGSILWNIKPRAVEITKIYLKVYLVYTIIASFLPFMAGLPSAANEAMIPVAIFGIIKSIIYYTVWFTFLQKSKRVKATYDS